MKSKSNAAAGKNAVRVTVRQATGADAERIVELLGQVLEVHAALRPDLFIPGTVKYTKEEVAAILSDSGRRTYVAVCDGGAVAGYAMCVLKKAAFSNTMIPRTSMFIDDFCIDESARGKGVGRALFEFVKSEAKREGCRDVTLCVWEGNDAARAFYDRMGMRPRETVMELDIPENE